jgi:hypothetical protein
MTGEFIPPAYDLQIVQDLQALLDKLANMRTDLYNRHSGCSCDERGLCAHHAQVHNRLITVADELARAIKDAQREG